jgi:hypothetical protein
MRCVLMAYGFVFQFKGKGFNRGEMKVNNWRAEINCWENEINRQETVPSFLVLSLQQ